MPMKAITLLKKEIQVSVLFQRTLLSFAPKLGQSYLLPEGVWLKMWPAFGKRVVVLVFFLFPIRERRCFTITNITFPSHCL